MNGKGRRSIKNVQFVCGQCRMDVKEGDDYIQCDKCAKILHALCTSLYKRQYDHLLSNESEEFICDFCDKGGSGNVKEELNEIKKQLYKLDQLSQLQETMNFMAKQYDDILRGVAEKKIEVVQKENRMLKKEVKTLKDSVKLLNDDRVKKDCLISGLEVKDDAVAVDTLLNISKGVGADLTEKDVEAAYFLRKRSDSSKKRTMVVKFDSKKSKDKLMSAKPKLKEKPETKSVYVNDFLSKETFNVFNHAKTLKTVGYQAVYTHNGRVYVKKSEIAKPKLIRNEDEVDAILMDATTNKNLRRRSNLLPINIIIMSHIM